MEEEVKRSSSTAQAAPAPYDVPALSAEEEESLKLKELGTLKPTSVAIFLKLWNITKLLSSFPSNRLVALNQSAVHFETQETLKAIERLMKLLIVPVAPINRLITRFTESLHRIANSLVKLDRLEAVKFKKS